jgi:hypothetical protein
MSRGRRSLAALAAAFAFVAAPAIASTAAHATTPERAPKLLDLRADVRVAADGRLTVKERQVYDFADGGPAELPRTFTTRQVYDSGSDQVFELSGFKATYAGEPIDVAVEPDDAETEVVLQFDGQPQRKQTVTLEYTVKGAVGATPDGLELSWPVVQGFTIPVEQATVTLSAPEVSWAACFAGRSGSARPCTATQLGELTMPRFDQTRLAAGARMTIVVGMPARAGVSADRILDRRWSLQHAFAVTPLSIGLLLALVLLAAAGAFLLWWLRGRDAKAPDQGEFEASEQELSPEGIRPGQLGTVVDERADVIDIVATVVDLAVRGHLVIVYPDWRIERTRPQAAGGDPLLPYEQRLLEVLLPGGVESCTLTELAQRAPAQLPDVQDRLYADVFAPGWFYQRPDAVRSRWTTAGVVLALAGVVLTIALAAATDLGLVGLGVVLAGGVLVFGGDLAPARTMKGSALLGKLHAFRERLETGEMGETASSHPERLLPYAIVFGSEERWAAALARTTDELTWLRTPQGWNRAELPGVVEDFVTSLSGTISTARRLRI